jgi:peptidoglycan L-alanyl-D-glutamate endopeptidase CwlK
MIDNKPKYDKVTLQRIQSAHPKLRTELRAIYEEIFSKLTGNAKVRFTHVLRTHIEQDRLYQIGRTTGIKGRIVTNAKGGDSYHNWSLACDFVLLIDDKEISYDMLKDYDFDGVADWGEVVNIFKKYGWTWGGDWKKFPDYPHFQKDFGYTIEQLKKLKTDNDGYVIFP